MSGHGSLRRRPRRMRTVARRSSPTAATRSRPPSTRRCRPRRRQAAWRAKKGSELADQPTNLMAAVVAIDPETGRVLAYYGGDNGTGTDYAGQNTERQWAAGRRPPAGLVVQDLHAGGGARRRASRSTRTGTPTTFKRRRHRRPDHATPAVTPRTAARPACSLAESTVQSYNVPFYHITEKIAAGNGRRHGQGRRRHHDVATPTRARPRRPDQGRQARTLAPDPFFTRGRVRRSTRSPCSTTPTVWPPWPTGASTTRPTSSCPVEKKNQETGKWEMVGRRAAQAAADGSSTTVADEVTAC